MRFLPGLLARLMLAPALLAAGAGAALAAASARQVLTYRIEPIHEIAVVNRPAAFRLTPGGAATATGTYSLTTNTPSRITAQIEGPLPDGVSLRARLDDPTGGTSRGDQLLCPEPVDLVVDVPRIATTNRTITYTLSAASSARSDLDGSATVTLTVTQ